MKEPTITEIVYQEKAGLPQYSSVSLTLVAKIEEGEDHNAVYERLKSYVRQKIEARKVEVYQPKDELPF